MRFMSVNFMGGAGKKDVSIGLCMYRFCNFNELYVECLDEKRVCDV